MNKILITILWLASLIATWFFSSPRLESSRINNSKRATEPVENAQSKRSFNSAIKTVKTSTDSQRLNSKGKLFTRSAEILLLSLRDQVDMDKDELVIKNVRHMSAFLENCSVEELIELAENNEGNESENWSIFQMLTVSALGEIAPFKALDLIKEKKIKDQMVGIEIIEQLAQKDYETAFETVGEYDSLDSEAYEIVFRHIGKNDLDRAFTLLKSLTENDRSYAVNGMIRNLKTSDDHRTIMKHLESDENENINKIIESWAEESPGDAREWVNSELDGDSGPKAEELINSTWLENKPVEAAEWLVQNENETKEAYELITHSWFVHEGDELSEWLKNQPDSESKENAYLKLTDRTDYISNSKQIEILENIFSETKRKLAVKQLYKNIIGSDQKEAEDFLKNNTDLSDEEKTELQNNFIPAED